MKVFLSWSGERSHRVAKILRDWLPEVIQALEPYVSSDIDKGVRWGVDIAKELELSAFGILCVTPENVESAWLNFEAGALSNKLDKSRVTPLLIGLKPTDITGQGPLAQFQATSFEREDVWGLIKSLNTQCGERKLEEGRLRKSFEKGWPDLEGRLANEVTTPIEKLSTEAASRELVLLEEAVELLRAQQRQLSLVERAISTSLEPTEAMRSETPSDRSMMWQVYFKRDGEAYLVRVQGPGPKDTYFWRVSEERLSDLVEKTWGWKSEFENIKAATRGSDWSVPISVSERGGFVLLEKARALLKAPGYAYPA